MISSVEDSFSDDEDERAAMIKTAVSVVDSSGDTSDTSLTMASPATLLDLVGKAKLANESLKIAIGMGGVSQDTLKNLRGSAIEANRALKEALKSVTSPPTPSVPSTSPPQSRENRLRPPFWLSWGTPPPRIPLPTTVPEADTPVRPTPSTLAGSLKNEHTLLQALLFLIFCGAIVFFTLRGGEAPSNLSKAVPTPPPQPVISLDDHESWSTGQCQWKKWAAESPVFNVTSIINTVNQRTPWSYGNGYLRSGERLFAVRHVLDSWTDDRFRYVVSRSNNLEVFQNPHVLTNFNWPIFETLISQGAMNVTEQYVYFFADTLADDRFVHYAGESAVFLPLFHAVLRDFPQAKLVLKRPRGYKMEFLSSYGVPPSKVIYGPPFPHPCNNLVLFPPLVLYNQWDTDLPMVGKLWSTQAEFLRRSGGLKVCSSGAIDPASPLPPPPPRRRRLLLLPRGSKENNPLAEAADFAEGGAGRRNFTEEAAVFSRAERELGGEVFLTDLSPSFESQAAAVDSASVILVLYGSAMFFNEALARNATVVVLGNQLHHLIMATFSTVHEYGERFNDLVIFPLPYTADAVLAELRRALLEVPGDRGSGRGTCVEPKEEGSLGPKLL